MTLPLISAGFAAFSLVMYVVLDGFDLGVGTLLFFMRAKASRDHLVDSITPTWDGNETWLIMTGVTLLAGFPIAYGILLPALYIPVIAMLLSLGLRGVSFEFRAHAKIHRHYWDTVFALGSTLAAFMQGTILGSLLSGIKTEGLRFAGSVLDIFQPLPMLSGLTLVVGYTVLGAGWLHFKANTQIHRFTIRVIRLSSVAFAALFGLVCLYASHTAPGVQAAWSAHPLALSFLSSLFIVLAGSLYAASGKKRPLLPFILGITQFLVGMMGIAIIVYPDIVPFHVSILDAASSHTSQVLLLVGAAVVTPAVIGYSGFAYWVFRGKTPEGGWDQ